MTEKLLKKLYRKQKEFNDMSNMEIEITCEHVNPDVYLYAFGSDVRYIAAENINAYLKIQIAKVKNLIHSIKSKNKRKQYGLMWKYSNLSKKALTYHLPVVTIRRDM